jgi:uncharacterized repeat protein (TIGR01451 family)
MLVSNSLTYTINVTNLNAFPLTDVLVTNLLSASFQFVNATGPSGTYSVNGNVAVFDLGSYFSTYYEVAQLTLTVRPTVAGSITNMVTVSSITVTNTAATNVVVQVNNGVSPPSITNRPQSQTFSWTLTSAPTNLTWDSVASSSDGTKLVAVDGPDGIIITSTNSGKTWAQAGSTDAYSVWQSVASSSDGTKLVIAAFGIYTSTNSGATWTQASSPQYLDAWVVASSSDGTKLVEAGNSGIYTSTNSGVTWNPTSENIGYFWQCVASSADGSTLAAVLDGGWIFVSTNSGATWNISGQFLNWQSIASSSDGTKLVAASAGSGASGTFWDGIYTSTNSGATWTQTTAPHLGKR